MRKKLPRQTVARRHERTLSMPRRTYINARLIDQCEAAAEVSRIANAGQLPIKRSRAFISVCMPSCEGTLCQFAGVSIRPMR